MSFPISSPTFPPPARVFVNGKLASPELYSIAENGMVIFIKPLGDLFEPLPDADSKKEKYPFWVVVEYEF